MAVSTSTRPLVVSKVDPSGTCVVAVRGTKPFACAGPNPDARNVAPLGGFTNTIPEMGAAFAVLPTTGGVTPGAGRRSPTTTSPSSVAAATRRNGTARAHGVAFAGGR